MEPHWLALSQLISDRGTPQKTLTDNTITESVPIFRMFSSYNYYAAFLKMLKTRIKFQRAIALEQGETFTQALTRLGYVLSAGVGDLRDKYKITLYYTSGGTSTTYGSINVIKRRLSAGGPAAENPKVQALVNLWTETGIFDNEEFTQAAITLLEHLEITSRAAVKLSDVLTYQSLSIMEEAA